MGRRPFVKRRKYIPVDPDKIETVEEYFARGGTVTVLPPAHASGWHGKPDPGADVAGMVEGAPKTPIG